MPDSRQSFLESTSGVVADLFAEAQYMLTEAGTQQYFPPELVQGAKNSVQPPRLFTNLLFIEVAPWTGMDVWAAAVSLWRLHIGAWPPQRT